MLHLIDDFVRRFPDGLGAKYSSCQVFASTRASVHRRPARQREVRAARGSHRIRPSGVMILIVGTLEGLALATV